MASFEGAGLVEDALLAQLDDELPALDELLSELLGEDDAAALLQGPLPLAAPEPAMALPPELQLPHAARCLDATHPTPCSSCAPAPPLEYEHLYELRGEPGARV